MWFKVAGAGFIVFGLAMIIFFPYIQDYQPEALSYAGVILGIIFFGIGLFLLKI